MPDTEYVHAQADRRRFLRVALSGAMGTAAVQAGINLVSPSRLSAQSNLSPDSVL